MIACADAISEMARKSSYDRANEHSGNSGETLALREAVRAAVEMPWLDVFHNRVIRHGKESCEADLIICGHSAIYLFEVKNVSGKLYDTCSGVWRQEGPNGRLRDICNGFSQLRRTRNLMAKSMSASVGISLRRSRRAIVPMLIFTGKRLDLSMSSGRRRNFVMIDELVDFIRHAERKYVPDVPVIDLSSFVAGTEKMSLLRLKNGREYRGRIISRPAVDGPGYSLTDGYIIFEPRGRKMMLFKPFEVSFIKRSGLKIS